MAGTDVSIRDGRDVRIGPLPDGCISRTPAGRTPIRCESAEITYDLPTGHLTSLTVWGYLTEQRDVDRRASSLRSYGRERANGVVVRRYQVDWKTHTADVPDWLAELIEAYRPGAEPERVADALTGRPLDVWLGESWSVQRDASGRVELFPPDRDDDGLTAWTAFARAVIAAAS